MSDPAAKIKLPPEFEEALEAEGYSPSSLMRLLDDLRASKARIAELEQPAERLWPLKAIVPHDIRREDARRAAKAGRLKATKLNGGRWFCTQSAMDRWAPTCRTRLRSR